MDSVNPDSNNATPHDITKRFSPEIWEMFFLTMSRRDLYKMRDVSDVSLAILWALL